MDHPAWTTSPQSDGLSAVKQTIATPRLSILLPLGQDRESFENTLISVLENRPSACEILVAHDGSYDDPFDLGDEVRFVIAESNGLVDAVAAGCDSAWGRYIHILEGGFLATEGWTNAALGKFEHANAAVVAPVIRSRLDETILAAGWTDTAARLMAAYSVGQTEVESVRGRALGAYLSASFWRREVLRSMTRACASVDPLVATYAYQHLCKSAGWKCVLAEQSTITINDRDFTMDDVSLSRGKTLRALCNHFCGGGATTGIVAMLSGIANLRLFPESIGQVLGGISPGNVAKWFNVDQVYSTENYESIRKAA
jgi:hypothetical protein